MMEKPELIDTHCHLESAELYPEIEAHIEAAEKAGVVKMITSSVTPDEWKISAGLASRFRPVEFSAGIHPWYVSESVLPALDSLGEALSRGAVAVGEIGLDKKIDSPGLDLQTIFFERQIAIAREMNLPVIIHCRAAFEELIASIKKHGPLSAGGTVHAFSGSAEIAERLMELGLSFSFGGVLTYKKSPKRERMLRLVYPHNFLLETDSPDIPPVGMRSRFNTPENILLNLRGAAGILGISQNEAAEISTANARRIFRL